MPTWLAIARTFVSGTIGSISSGWRLAETSSPASDDVEVAERSQGGRLENMKRSKRRAYLDYSIIWARCLISTPVETVV